MTQHLPSVISIIISCVLSYFLWNLKEDKRVLKSDLDNLRIKTENQELDIRLLQQSCKILSKQSVTENQVKSWVEVAVENSFNKWENKFLKEGLLKNR